MDHSYGEVLLQLESVSLSYGGKQILRDVDATVRDVIRPGVVQGQVVGFLGPSGIGKTQLFRLISGLNRPTSGRVLIQGKEPGPGDVGVVAQNYPLFEHRTVRSNLMLAAGRRADHEGAERAVLSYAQAFDLLDRLDAYPAQLSGGQRQRAAIVQQVLCSGHFLLMDEPFSGLDVVMLERTCDLISRIVGMHELNTVVVVTHDVTAAAAVSDHIWLMGREEGKPGARIVKEYDLIERGLAWKPGVVTSPELMDFVREVKNEFRRL